MTIMRNLIVFFLILSNNFVFAQKPKLVLPTGHTDRLSSAVFSSNNKLLLTASNDKTARIFDVVTGKELQVLSGHKNELRSAVFSTDGKLVLTASNDKTARIYDVTTGSEQLLFEHNTSVRAAFFSSDCKLALTMCDGDTACIYDVASGNRLQVMKGYIAVFSPNDNLVLTASYDDTVRIYDVVSGKILQKLGHEYELKTAVFSPDGMLALTASADNVARIYDLATGKELKQFFTGQSNITSAVFSPDNKLILTACEDNTARIFDLSLTTEIQVLIGHTDDVKSADFSSDGKLVLTASSDGTARIYEVSTGKELHILNGHQDIISTAVFSSDSKMVLTSCWDTKARVFDVVSGKELQVLTGLTHSIVSQVFSTDSELVLTSSQNGSARIYELASGKELEVISEQTGSIKSSFSSRDSMLSLVIGEDNSVRIKEVSSGKILHILNGHTQLVNSAIFSPDGKLVLTTAQDHKSILWNLSTGQSLYTRLQLENGDWLVYDEHYRFDGSQGARDYLYFVCGSEIIDMAQLKDVLYVPNLAKRIMNDENLDRLPKLKDLEICGITPVIEQLEYNKYKIRARKGGIGNVEIFINGALRKTIDSNKLTSVNGVYELNLDENLIRQFETAEQETKIKIIARTADNKISSRGVISESITEVKKNYRKPNLFAVMVGIDDYKDEGLDLNYAAKDASDLQMALESSTKKFFNIDDTNRVHFYKLIVDRKGKIDGLTPDRNNILYTIDEITKKSKPEDLLLIFFAGHGEVNKDNQLILLTSEASREEAPNYSGITIKELLEKLAIVPAGKRILLLDACHSGAAIEEITAKLRDAEEAEKQSQKLKQLENLASKSGLVIITASSSNQKAMELPQYEHGLMTYALLNTMMNEPTVLDVDNNLQLANWFQETERTVSRIMENQTVQSFMSNLNFKIGKIDDDVRNSVDLKEIPTIFIKDVSNRNTDEDELHVELKLKNFLSESASRGNEKLYLAEKENSNAFTVKVSYEILDGKIESRITIKKKEVLVKQFNFSGKENDILGYVKGLGEEILKNIRA
jgi:WD40 repeat protein